MDYQCILNVVRFEDIHSINIYEDGTPILKLTLNGDINIEFKDDCCFAEWFDENIHIFQNLKHLSYTTRNYEMHIFSNHRHHLETIRVDFTSQFTQQFLNKHVKKLFLLSMSTDDEIILPETLDSVEFEDLYGGSNFEDMDPENVRRLMGGVKRVIEGEEEFERDEWIRRDIC